MFVATSTSRRMASWFDSPKKRMKRSGGRQRSGHQHGRVIAIAAIAPNGEMGRDSVADANGR
jgi:hypothetical protein